jgi:hypothetical protein
LFPRGIDVYDSRNSSASRSPTGSDSLLRDSTITPDGTDPHGLLGSATVVDARTGRKLNNAVTLTFRTSPEETIAVGAQVGSAAVLLGFKNTGDAGRFTLKGPAGELALDCRAERTTVTTAGGNPVAPVSTCTGRSGARSATCC